MKIKKYFSLLCLVTTLIGYSCSDDMDLQPENTPVVGESRTVRIAASLQDDGSRLGYKVTDSSVEISWDLRDTLKVINATTNEMAFFALADTSFSGKSYGVFEGTFANGCEDGDSLHVLYHNGLVETSFNTDGNLDISLKEQNGQLNQDYQLMFGKTAYTSDKAVGVDLRHLVSIFEISIPTTKTLKKLSLNDERLSSKATLVLGNSPANYNGSFEVGDMIHCNNDDFIENADGERFRNDNHIITAEGTFVPKNDTVTVYCYVLPTKRYDQGSEEYSDYNECEFSFKAEVDGEENVEYVNSNYYEPRGISQGEVYSLTTGIFSLVDFEAGDGTANNPYIITNMNQLYTFNWLGSNELKNEAGQQYNHLCYKLANDIELDGSVYWRGIHYSKGTFDGDNHIISGKKENWFFDGISDGAKVMNLKLNVQVTIKKTGRDSFGVLSSSARDEGTEIINCHNLGDIDVDFYNSFAGALIGNFEWGAKIIGCSNIGNLTVTGPEAVGGMVGRISTGASMEACYSTGTITVTDGFYETIYVGGLSGTIAHNEPEEYRGKTKMTSCWEDMEFDVKKYSDNISAITAYGEEGKDWFSCYKVDIVPTDSLIAVMNASMTNKMYEFAADGTIVAKKPSTSLPGYDIEDF